MSEFASVLVTGLTYGAVYALVALAFTMCFRAGQALNFGIGTLMLFGGYLCVSALARNNAVLGLAIAAVACAIIAGGGYYLGFHRATSLNPIAITIITMGASFVGGALIDLEWHSQLHVYPFPGASTDFRLVGSAFVSALDIAIVAGTLVVFGLVALFFRLTGIGIRMKASANAPSLAARSGLNVSLLTSIAWGISGLMAGIGGGLYGAVTSVSPDLGNVGLLAFPAAVLGGLGSIPGALVGGLLLGLTDQIGVYYISPASAEALAYLIMLGVLMVRPTGLFGEAELLRL